MAILKNTIINEINQTGDIFKIKNLVDTTEITDANLSNILRVYNYINNRPIVEITGYSLSDRAPFFKLVGKEYTENKWNKKEILIATPSEISVAGPLRIHKNTFEIENIPNVIELYNVDVEKKVVTMVPSQTVITITDIDSTLGTNNVSIWMAVDNEMKKIDFVSEDTYQYTTKSDNYYIGFGLDRKPASSFSARIAVDAKNINASGIIDAVGKVSIGSSSTSATNGIAIGNFSSTTNGIAIGSSSKTNDGTNIGAGDQTSENGSYLCLGVSEHLFAYKTAATADWAGTSDKRDKIDFKDITNALEFINKLNPVTFRENLRSDYIENGKLNEKEYKKGSKSKNRRSAGFKAQDVYNTMKSVYNDDNYAAIVDYTKYDHPDAVEDKYFMRTTELIPFLTKAIQEQSEIINKLEKRIIELEKKIK